MLHVFVTFKDEQYGLYTLGSIRDRVKTYYDLLLSKDVVNVRLYKDGKLYRRHRRKGNVRYNK